MKAAFINQWKSPAKLDSGWEALIYQQKDNGRQKWKKAKRQKTKMILLTMLMGYRVWSLLHILIYKN